MVLIVLFHAQGAIASCLAITLRVMDGDLYHGVTRSETEANRLLKPSLRAKRGNLSDEAEGLEIAHRTGAKYIKLPTGEIDFVEAPHAQHNSNKFGSAFA